LQSAANDIIRTLTHLKLTSKHDSRVVGVIGHSFGGRVALQYVKTTLHSQESSIVTNNQKNGDEGILTPEVMWLLDTYPDVAHSSVANVIGAISRVRLPIQNKDDLVSFLTQENNISPAIAAWMATNLVRVDGGFHFKFDLPVILNLIEDYKNQDFFGTLNDINRISASINQKACQVHLVQAGKNDSWDNAVVQDKLTESERLGVLKSHCLPNAGHWVHVDDLDGLMDLIEPTFSEYK
jgi:esterase